jgi:hypothetical protein
MDCATCLIFGRRAPTFRSFGFAYGSTERFNHESTRIQTMAKSEMTNAEGMTKCRTRSAFSVCHSDFVLNSSFDIRASAFHNSCLPVPP